MSDSVIVNKKGMIYYNLCYLNILENYVKCKLYLEFGENFPINIFFYENKIIEIEFNSILYNNIEEFYNDNKTSFKFNDNNLNLIEINFNKSDNDYLIINNLQKEIIIKEIFFVDNITNPGNIISDLNKCIYNKEIDQNIYPFYITNSYLNEINNFYGDLNTFEDYFFINLNENNLKENIFKICAKGENNTLLILEFLPFSLNENDYGIGIFKIKIRTCFNNEFKEYNISINLYYSIKEIIKWKNYFESNNIKLNFYYNKNDLKENKNTIIWFFENNFVINKKFPFSLVTYRYIYSILTSHNSITKNDYYQKNPPYDKFYPIAFILKQNNPFLTSNLSENSIITNENKIEILQSIGIIPNIKMINKIPNNVLLELKKNRVLYFLIEIKTINDNFIEIINNRYLPILIYYENNNLIIKNTYNNIKYNFKDFIKSFNIDFENNKIKETNLINKILFNNLFPINTLYGEKNIIPGFFYYNNFYISFYSNKQYELTENLYLNTINKILNNNYINYKDFFENKNYIRKIYLNNNYIESIIFIYLPIKNYKYYIASDCYEILNNKNYLIINKFIKDFKIEFNNNNFFKIIILENNIKILINEEEFYSIGKNYFNYFYLNLTYNNGFNNIENMLCYIKQKEMLPIFYSQDLEKFILSKYNRNNYIENININSITIKSLLIYIRTRINYYDVIISNIFKLNKIENNYEINEIILNAYTNNEIIIKKNDNNYINDFINLFNLIIEERNLIINFNNNLFISALRENNNYNFYYNYQDLYYNFNTESTENVQILIKN